MQDGRREMNRGGATRGARLLLFVAGLASRRSRLVVGVWIAAVFLLASLGRNLDQELSVHPLFIDGTDSKRAHDIALREFGDDYATVVMLRGPRRQVDDQGHALAARLDAMPGIVVATPWAGGRVVESLQPSPNVAVLVVRFASGKAERVSEVLPPVRRAVGEEVGAPVRASIAGFPVMIDSLRSASDRATQLGELIAVPVLLIVLLLVFRSVVAAAMPIVVGGAVVAATRGLLSIFNHFIQVDLFALGAVGMMGLALGVDYSLLVLSRFREERRKHDHQVAEAVQATVLGTARSLLPAGGGLILAMIMATLVLPGSVVRSVALAVSAATLLSVISAICVVPALLVVLGDKLDRWALPMRQTTQIAPLRWSRRIARRPGAVAALLAGLVFLAGWAFSLDTGVGSTALLPSSDPGRQQLEEVEDTLGSGWVTPAEIVVDGRGRPLTSRSRLRALIAFQRQVEREPGVKTMVGFGSLGPGLQRLDGVEAELAEQERGLDRLAGGIGKAHGGASLMSAGLGKAAAGSGELEIGLGAAQGGAQALAGALDQAGEGSRRLADGLGRVSEGGGKLAEGTAQASDGAGRLSRALGEASEQTGQLSASARLMERAMHSGEDRLDEVASPLQESERRLATAWQALQRMSSGRADPEYATALAAVEEASLRLTGKDPRSGETVDPSYEGVGAGIERARGEFGVGLYLSSRLAEQGSEAGKGIEKLAEASGKLDRGLHRLARGSSQVSDGLEALDGGGERLSPALRRLGDGAEHLSGGLSLLEAGAGQLAGGLGEGARKSRLLGRGLGRIETGLQAQQGDSGLAQLRQQSPGLFRSPYLVLAGIDGSPPRQRSQLASLISLDNGGTNARMLVVPRDEATTGAAEETKSRLEADAEELARRMDAEVVVGGTAPGEIDVNNWTREKAPLLRVLLSLVTFVVLIPVLRSLTIPFLAALINLLTVSAAFGLLALLFDDSLLGGPGYIDASVITATMMVMFGLAIDYEVFVFARIREEYVRTGSTSAAVAGGLDRTAHVVTGAALIMISVFLAFSVSEFVTIRNFGIAQAVGVAIDAFIVRLVIVPAMMNRLGRWCWWMPSWLDRLLPGARSPAAPDPG